jgi:hypothetical protein
MEFNLTGSGSIMRSNETQRFIDDFVNADRPLPDLSLLAILAIQQASSDVHARAVYNELMLTYVLGLVTPTLSTLEGVVWKPGDIN